MNHWIVKSEPVKYSWEKFLKEGRTFWDGVRSYQARNNLHDMWLHNRPKLQTFGQRKPEYYGQRGGTLVASKDF